MARDLLSARSHQCSITAQSQTVQRSLQVSHLDLKYEQNTPKSYSNECQRHSSYPALDIFKVDDSPTLIVSGHT